MRRGIVLVIVAACSGKSSGPAPGASSSSSSAAAPRVLDPGPPDPAEPTLPAPPAGPVRFVEARLATHAPHDDDDARSIVWGATGRAVAWIDRGGVPAKERVIVNDAPERAFDHVDDLELAPDGTTPVYVANEGGKVDPTDRMRFVHGGTFRLVIGAQVGPPTDGVLILHDADYPDEPFHYLVRHGLTQSVVVARHVGPALRDIDITNLRVLPDGRPIFQAKEPDGEHVVIGDDVGPAYLGTTRPRPSSAGRVAYGARDATGAFVVIDRTPGARYDDLDGVDMSPDGTPAYEGTRGDKRYGVVGTTEIGPYDRAMDFAFPPKGGHAAFKARLGERWFVVVDGKAGPTFADIGGNLEAAVWSDDGAHVAYIGGLADPPDPGEVVVRDGRREASADRIEWLGWSRDGKHLAYVAEHDHQQRMIVDGVAGPPFADISPPSFDADGRVVYEAKRVTGEDEYLGHVDWCVVHGTAPACYDDVGEPGMIAGDQQFNFVLDPGGHHLAFRALRDGHWFIVVDGKEGPPADRLWGPWWSADGAQLGYGARRGDELWWRVATP